MKTWEGDEDANLEECKLLSGQFAALLQVLLGLIALSVLVAKRLRETPRRPLAVWAFDASKQMIGAGFAHVANLLIAILLYSYEDAHADSDQEVDQCAFYFVNFALDTSFGVFLNFIFLEAFSMLAQRFGWVSVMTPGDYGDPVRVRPWLLQLVSWIGVIFTTKFVISLFILALEKPLGDFAVWLFTPLQAYPDVELAVVMIACPCLMNALQFWIQDSFLKKDVRDESILVDAASASPSTLAATKKLGTPSDEETDGREDEDDEAATVVVISGKDKGKTKAKKDSETKSKKDTELKATAG